MLQINVLPPWNRSRPDLGIEPFEKVNGKWNFRKINEIYFDRAASLLEIAQHHGFIPALAPLWCDCLPGTWASADAAPGHVMPHKCVEPYIRYVVEKFRRFDQIYLASGDPLFQGEAENGTYLEIMRIIKEMSSVGC